MVSAQNNNGSPAQVTGTLLQEPIPPVLGRSNRVPQITVPISPGKSLESFTLMLAASETRLIPAIGDRFFVLSATGYVLIAPSNAQPVPYVAGQSLILRGSQFKQLTVTNPSSTAQLKLLLVAGFDDYQQFSPPAIPGTVTEGQATIAQTGVVQPISATDIYFVDAWFYGYSSVAVANVVLNGANINFGKSKAFLPDIIVPGAVDWPVRPPPGKMWNLANLYMVGTQGDGLFYSTLI